ncbi:uncharacterized protein LOC112051008 isoform X12 [Bicyclus anynana]|uniref:Uncharacterized protein LOC112051008 isoform X12 n=1 Tax=Bicyclus anynana TaxID=110368 RepID=A0ABM3M5Q4_BICAN|nr:uncharacterized protein LOC112051008 isoform X12 [Bicyclus anynana]
MRYCVVKSCKNHSGTKKKREGITFHRFPALYETWKNDWIQIIRQSRKESDWVPNKYSAICSKHFDTGDFYSTINGSHRIVTYAVPKHFLYDTSNPIQHYDEASTTSALPEVPLDATTIIEIEESDLSNSSSSSKENVIVVAESSVDGFILRESCRVSLNKNQMDIRSYSPLLVFNDRRQETSPEGEPSTSTRYQTSRFVVEDEAENEEEEVEQIIIKEEVSEEEKNQCRLCLSVNRRMWELGENAPLYRKLLFETNQNSTMPSFIYEMLACWECHAELRKIRRFQDKVRRANSAFETSQNLNCQELSNLGTVLITEEQPSNSELQEDMIKQEPLDIEETAVPDPLDVNRAPKEEIIIEVPRRKFTPKTTKRTSTTKTSQNTPKRTKIDPNTQEDPQTDAPVDCDEIFCKVKIELEELQSILEGRRNKDSFKNMKYKCDSCVLGFTDYSRLQEHNASFHDEETGICSCDICERRFTDERLLATHTRNHFVKFVCRLCPFECYTKTGRMIHFRRHKEAVQSDDPDSVLRQKLSSMESTGESSHDLD